MVASGQSLSELLSKGEISFQEFVSEGISDTVFFGDLDSLQTKEGQMQCEFRLVRLENS